MPLRDHFHPPLSVERSWTGLHGSLATALAIQINKQLPAGYFAEPTVQFGIEIDVAAFDHRRNGSIHPGSSTSDWPASPTQTITQVSTLTDVIGVQVFLGAGTRRLVGAMDLISPANKDRPESRFAFVSKCLSVLRAGVGLIVVDIVTERHSNLHQAILERWGGPQDPPFEANLYAVAYRPILNEDAPAQLATWVETLALRRALPTLPLWIVGVGPLGINLEAVYEQTLRDLRFPAE